MSADVSLCSAQDEEGNWAGRTHCFWYSGSATHHTRRRSSFASSPLTASTLSVPQHPMRIHGERMLSSKKQRLLYEMRQFTGGLCKQMRAALIITPQFKFQEPVKPSHEGHLLRLTFTTWQFVLEPHAGALQTNVIGKLNWNPLLTLDKRLSLTYIEDVQGGDVRGSRAQLIGCFHPDLVRSEEGDVAGDVAGVTLVSCAVIFTLLLFAVPSGHKNRDWIWCLPPQRQTVFLGVCILGVNSPVYLRAAGWGNHL